MALTSERRRAARLAEWLLGRLAIQGAGMVGTAGGAIHGASGASWASSCCSGARVTPTSLPAALSRRCAYECRRRRGAVSPASPWASPAAPCPAPAAVASGLASRLSASRASWRSASRGVVGRRDSAAYISARS